MAAISWWWSDGTHSLSVCLHDDQFMVYYYPILHIYINSYITDTFSQNGELLIEFCLFVCLFVCS